MHERGLAGFVQWLRGSLHAGPNAIVVGGVVAALTLAVLCAVALYQSRTDALEHARESSHSIALAAQRDIERNFEIYALSLRAVADGITQPDIMALPPHLRRMVLFDRAATADYQGGLYVLDASGNIVVDSESDVPHKENFADRPWFTVHRDRADAGLFISDPYVPRMGGGLRMALSVRLSHPDGSFAGVAVMAIRLEYFQRLFEGLAVGPHGAMSLVGTDGVMIMREPFEPGIPGRSVVAISTFRHLANAPEGYFSAKSVVDGVRRHCYFRRFAHLPFIIVVAEADPDIFGPWRQRADKLASVMALFALVLIGLSVQLSAQLRRRMRAESELRLLARTDGLTGLANRRRLDETLEHEWRRARRTRRSLAILFIDVDCFKAFNDRYGHQAGDDALATVARCIAACLRQPADTAARYGGEEFLTVLPETSESDAVALAGRIREAVWDLAIEHAASPFGRITVSIGIASSQSGAVGSRDELIRMADEALYRAKAAGRNGIVAGPRGGAFRHGLSGARGCGESREPRSAILLRWTRNRPR
ncbi:sensor domain-containing diguanylate cyclase [Paraburkholderia acidipaludis]|uniref:sensor domain-containing diguanylate cyclase n=1 Tax=Paraburkholderia acidipaludis TaxID=660537 RepID=UPI0005BAC579|nr:sensor domain-containing diguanylate cyclase [Paraburkholderia acidipaludis]